MEHSRERLIMGTALGSSAVLLAWTGRAIVPGQLPLTGDLLRSYYPFRDFYAHALASGQRFDWMPSLLGGFDFTGASQDGGDHPLHWLLYRLLRLDVAFDVEMVMPYPLLFAGAGTLLLVVWWLAGLPARRARGEMTTADRFGLWGVAISVLGLWLALGQAGHLYTLETRLPIVNEFRVPLRYALSSFRRAT